jgi:peptidyl-prolyl cis-trans isomerase D
MLQSIRDRLVGWVAWAIVLVIGVPFAILGVTDFGSPVRKVAVAEVGDLTVSQQQYRQRYQARRQSLQRQLGANYRPDIFDQKIQEQTLDALVEEKLLEMIAEENNVFVGDKELASTIHRDPGFQKNGKFDNDYYRSRIGQLGYTPTAYEEFLRSEMRLNLLPRAVRVSSFLTPEERRRFNELSLQERKIEYIEVDRERFLADLDASEEEAKAYYEQNQSEFSRPEQVRMEYIQLNADMLKDRVDSSEEALLSFYQENTDRFIVEEQRKASHILLTMDENQTLDDNSEVSAKLNAIQEKMAAGVPFEELAKQYSDDPGSAEQGGDLGQVARGVMVPPFENALFSMTQPGKVSQPVRTSYGVHLIRLDGIVPGKVKSFEDVKDSIAQEYAKEQAINIYYTLSERLAELSYEHPDTLVPAAEELQVELKTTDWVGLDGGTGPITVNKDVLRAAFSERVKIQGENSEPVEVGVNDVVVLRVKESRPASTRTFDEVKALAKRAVRLEKAEEKVSEYIKQLTDKLKQGESAETVAESEGLEYQNPGAINRKASDVPSALTRAVFSMPHPEENRPVIESVMLGQGKHAIVLLEQVIKASEKSDENLSDDLNSRLAAMDAGGVMQVLRNDTEIVIHKDKLE